MPVGLDTETDSCHVEEEEVGLEEEGIAGENKGSPVCCQLRGNANHL